MFSLRQFSLRRFSLRRFSLRQGLCVAVCTLLFAGLYAPAETPPELESVPYPPRQEQVADFGALVPDDDGFHRAIAAAPLERVTSAVPWARGMALVDGELVVLSRGRHRGDGGVAQDLVDHAGTLWRVDASVAEPVVPGAPAGQAVRNNAEVFARPSQPPMYLYDYSTAPEIDTRMARPFCALAYHAASGNLFVCAYSGLEGDGTFRKHATDAVYRFNLARRQWFVVEQHDPAIVPAEELGPVVSNSYYPHHDPAKNPPPHGWPNGPNGCTPAGRYLYVPAKDNHLVVQYDLSEILERDDAPAPASRPVLGPRTLLRYPGGEREMEVLGASSVAVHGGYLYVGYRTSSVVVRFALDSTGDLVRRADGRIAGELIAVFEPWDAATQRSGNLYDLGFSEAGDLFVSMGTEGRVWRFTPNPEAPFYGNDQSGRPTSAPPFVDLSQALGKKAGCNNIMVDGTAYLYISSRSNDTGTGRLRGTIYRVAL